MATDLRDGKPVGRPINMNSQASGFPPRKSTPLLTMQHTCCPNLDTGGPASDQTAAGLPARDYCSADNPAKRFSGASRIETVGARQFHLSTTSRRGRSAPWRMRPRHPLPHARGTDEVTEREVSPQRLVPLPRQLVLDAWCHLRDGLRAFSVDAIKHAEIPDNAPDVATSAWMRFLGSGYGIFSGEEASWATLAILT